MAPRQNVLSDRYEVKKQLGEGGMGVVYLAHDRNLDTDVVIKLPRPGALAEPGFAERFTREIRALVKMAHPRVVKILDVGQHAGNPYAVMQFLSGGSLGGRGIPAPPERLNDWLLAIAEALDFVHAQGILHRDVKPANILFDAHGNAYLSDFGVAKVLSASQAETATEQLTGAGLVIGTAEYLAPELIMGKDNVDGRADQYALAATVYEVLAGKVPFDGPNPSAIMVKQTAAKLPPLRSAAPRISEALAAAVERGLNKDPRKRFATCAEFARAVLAAASGVGGPPPLPDRPSAQNQGPRPAPVSVRPTVNPAREAATPARGQIAATRIEAAPAPVTPARATPGPVAATRTEAAPVVPPSSPTPARPAAASHIEAALSLPVNAPLPLERMPTPPPSTRARPPRKTTEKPAGPGAGAIALTVLVCLAMVAGASGFIWYLLRGRDGKPPEGPKTAAARFRIEPVARTNLAAGGTARIPIKVVRNEYKGRIELSYENLPEGVTARLLPLEAGMTETELKLDANETVAAREALLKVVGTADGERQEATFTLAVLAAPKLELRAKDTAAVHFPFGFGTKRVPVEVIRQGCADQVVMLRVQPGTPLGIRVVVPPSLPPNRNTFDVEIFRGTKKSKGPGREISVVILGYLRDNPQVTSRLTLKVHTGK